MVRNDRRRFFRGVGPLGAAIACVVLISAGMTRTTYAGTGDSASGRLDTVRPAVVSVAAVTSWTLSIAFSEPMRAPEVAFPGNYILSGAGRGNLAANPASVSGVGPYTLNWASGEMLDGGSVTVTVTGVQDAVGNPVGSVNSAGATGIGDAPTGAISIDDGALPGYTRFQSVGLTLFAYDPSGVARMRFSNDNVTWTPPDWASASLYSVNYSGWPLSIGDGVKTVYVQYQDGAGNVSTATISDVVTLDTQGPKIAVRSLWTEQHTPTMTGWVTDAAGVTGMSIAVNGQAYEALVAGGTWTVQVTDPLPEGVYDLELTATDSLGNTTIDTTTFHLLVVAELPAAGWFALGFLGLLLGTAACQLVAGNCRPKCR